MNTALDDPGRRPSLATLMRRDACLPADIVPGGESPEARSAVLVTGATGFLGRYVVRELLARPNLLLRCLVRANDDLEAQGRLANSLAQAGIDVADHGARLTAVAGAADLPQFGLGDARYRSLADEIGQVYHCAADVNWARGYRQLRSSNVVGTLEVIRFASTGYRKRVLYASTIAVCFGTITPASIDESTDMLDYVAHLPLPYAQTKCVSESLLRAASSRGLPVSVIRPALISGDSETGVSNPGDLISALIQGCVLSGSAIDTNWQLDCVPVDHIAKVLARLGETSRQNWELLHLFDERGRAWREVVLWMNLYGYPIELAKHAEWLRRTFDRLSARYSLFGYRRFFGAGASRNAGPAPYESYLANRQSNVSNAATRATLERLGIHRPVLDARLLERYLEHYQSVGTLPPASRAKRDVRSSHGSDPILRRTLAGWLGSRRLDVKCINAVAMPSHNGIFNEVASAQAGNAIGIHRFAVEAEHKNTGRKTLLDVLLKTKPSDRVMQDLLVDVAALCDPRLGMLCRTFRDELGLAGSHERELAVFEIDTPLLSKHLPRVYGVDRDAESGTWSVAMEFLREAAEVDVAAGKWCETGVGSVLNALASIHAAHFDREQELQELDWLSAPPSAARMRAMTPLWRALADFSSNAFDAWLDESLLPLQQSFIASIGDWWPEMQSLPRTLVHNDCNPRNFVVRRDGDKACPVFFDWELATIDLPQRDAAELLCFVLPANSNHRDLAAYLDTHRNGLESIAGIAIDERDWLRGFMHALRHLVINRLPLYALMHRFRPQAFLPRVIQNWHTLYRLGCRLELKSLRRTAGTMATSAVAAAIPKTQL